MSIKKLSILALLGILFVSCKKEPTLEEYMVDTWQTSYLKIDMPTFQKGPNSSVFEDKFEPTAQRFARSTYNPDGTFNSWYVDNAGNDIGGTTVGHWKVEGDSLQIEYVYDGRDVKVKYFVERTEEGFKATSKYDWDQDGEFDDILLMNTKRIQLQ